MTADFVIGAYTAGRYRTIQIQAGSRIITAAEPVPDDFRQALEAITHAS